MVTLFLLLFNSVLCITYRTALKDIQRGEQNPIVSVRMRYLSVSHSANALLVRRGRFDPAESSVHGRNPRDKGARPRDKVQLFDVIKTAQSYLKITDYLGTTVLACVVYRTRAFFVLSVEVQWA